MVNTRRYTRKLRRIKQLPPGARDVLNVLAVARRPVNEDVALNAAGLSATAVELIAALRNAQLVRSSGTGYGVEIYHDRIAEMLVSLLADDERKQIHRRLAQTIEARGLDDPEGLYEHYLGAGDGEHAAIHAEVAAHQAVNALAFDQQTGVVVHIIEGLARRGEQTERLVHGRGIGAWLEGRPGLGRTAAQQNQDEKADCRPGPQPR